MTKTGLPLFTGNASEGMNVFVQYLQTACSITLMLEHAIGLHLTSDSIC